MADNVYNLKFTLSNGDVIDAGQITAPQGPKGDKGDSATVDADTLIALLLGSNGIEIAKNTAGDKVELKIPDKILISNSLGKAQLSPQTISLFFNSENVGFLIDAIAGGMYKTNGSEQQWYLHQGNVKTLFGNQSIYGSGNIDLYRHSLYIHFEHKSGSDTRQIQMYVQLISSSNTNIDSLIDLFSMFSNIKDIPASGTVTGGLGQNGVCVSVTEFSMSGKITAMLVDGGVVQYDIRNATLQSIRDTVTTV